MKSNLNIISLVLFFIAIMNGAFCQSSFVNSYTQANASTLDVGNAVTTDPSGNVYVTGIYNNSLLVKRFNATLVPDLSWTPVLNFPSTVGYDIDYYNGFIYVTAFDGSVSTGREIVLIKINVATQAVVTVLYSNSNHLANAPIAYSATVNAEGYTIVGSFDQTLDFAGNLAISESNANSTSNLFIAKFDLNLNELWLTYIPSSHDAAGYSISTVQVNGGSYFSYITGYFARNDATPNSQSISFPGTPTIFTAGGNDVFVAKFQNLNTVPTFSWSRAAGGTLGQIGQYRQDCGYGITAVANGDCYIIGQFKGSATFGTTTPISCGTSTFQSGFVAKYTTGGTCSWSRLMGGCNTLSHDAAGYGIAFLGSTLFVTGSTRYSNNFGLGIYSGKYNASNGSTIYESIGKNLNSGGLRKGNAIVANSCDVYLVGSYSSNVTLGLADAQTVNTPADEDYFVSRLATNGNVKFTTADCSSGPFTLQASNGSSYLWSTGATTGNITVSPTVATNYTVTVTSGSCTRSIPATVHPSYVANAGLDKDVLCPGPPNCATIGTILPGNPTYTWTPSTGLSCTSCAQPNTCYPTTYTLTVKYNSCPSTTDQVSTYTGIPCRVANNESDLNSEFSIFPNPNNGVFTISGKSINTPLIIYDSYGRQIKKVITKDEGFTIDISDQPKGLYLISDGNSIRSRIIVN